MAWFGEVPHRRLRGEPALLATLERSSTVPPTSPAHRLVELDFLRAVAITLVLFRHCEVLLPSAPDWVKPVLAPVVRAGWIGVDLFFVLSGFLVSNLLFRELERSGRLDPWRFLTRRAFKILPSFWIYLGFVVLVETVRQGGVPWGRTAAEFFFVQNYLPGLAVQTWSLAVEEHFYLLLPAGLIALTAGGLRHDRLQWLPAIFAGVALAILAARGWLAISVPYSHWTHLCPTHLRLDALFAGVILAYVSLHRAAWLRSSLDSLGRGGWLIVGLALAPALILEVGSHPLMPFVGLAANTLGFALLIALLLHSGLPRGGLPGQMVRAVAASGGWSYCTYLWHLELIGRVTYYNGGRWPFWFVFPLCFCGSFALGGIMTHLVERPFLQLRDRWVPTLAGSNRSSVVAPTGFK